MTQGLARAGFDIDLRDGQAAESALVHIFLGSRVEVKRDEMAHRTGRVFVETATEIFNRDGELKPSGINVTEAAWYAFYLAGTGRWILIETPRLRRLVILADQKGLTTRGGDNNRFHGALIPLDWLVREQKGAA